ncbi:MAG: hypothetical protein ACLUEK_05085 [Oscillospiraceae bacterium]
MKKLLALCIVFALALTLCACGQEAPAEDSPAALPTEETPSLSLSP